MIFAVTSPDRYKGWPAYFLDPQTGKPYELDPEYADERRKALMDAINPFAT